MKFPLILLFPLFLLQVLPAESQVTGCTDSLAINYNPAATVNDGSCAYDQASIAPLSSIELSSQISETSGLTFWNNLLWTHNDNTDTKLYGLDTVNGNIIQTYLLNNITNTDWEEISEDNDYLYIGDFGNNYNGNRTDLKILRVSKASLLSNNPLIDTIGFSYSDQINFSLTGANNTDFDCEAMIVSTDSIYLFTKQWVSKGTSVYSLPKTPGMYIAEHISGYDVEGLVTGATYLEEQRLVILCGYSVLLSPFTWLLYDFPDHRFFSGNKRKISVSLPFHQTEAVYTANGLKVYVTNEAFIQFPFINNPQQLHIFDFAPFLAGYLNNQTLTIDLIHGQKDVFIFPNPATTFVFLKVADSLKDQEFRIINSSGSIIEYGRMTGNAVTIDVSRLRSGIYLIKIGNDNRNTLRLIRR
jgi:hypothetical protein